jgi:hypothetical protein
MSVPQQGTETRSTILPSSQPSGIGYLGSPYSPADALKTPSQVGVTTGDSLGDVMNAVKGVAFYTDMIGFGQSSSSFTQGMPLEPLGVNYFLNTGQTCSNGATMYKYFQGIPQGNVLGNRVQQAMQQMGLPALRGLAPGMIEDAESALNPSPMLNALFGSGYPQCKQATLQVGDMYGNITDPSTGQAWIESPETATRGQDGLMYQTRWVQDTDPAGNDINLTKDEWENTPKMYNPDGTPITSSKKEAFANFVSKPTTIATIGILCALMFGMMSVKRR